MMKKTITIAVGCSGRWVMVGSPERITDDEYQKILVQEKMEKWHISTGVYHVTVQFKKDHVLLTSARIIMEL